jgi:hypothetical protein
MFIPFNSIADHSRVWIYQADRKISSSEKDIIFKELTAFTEQWQVHGQPMKTSFQIFYDHFIVLAADEGYNAASGCSIDGSVRILKNLGEQLQLDFFDRTKVAFLSENDSDDIIILPLNSLKQKNKEGMWTGKTITFNNLVPTKEELQKQWLTPASETWLSRYLSNEATVA